MIDLQPLAFAPSVSAALAAILVDVVAGGGSVGFLHPLSIDDAVAFWDRALAAADRGERIVLGARDDGQLVGTLSLLLDLPPNQPHRAELAKMMTRVDRRGRGIASALVREAERLAIERGRTLLVLDTASDEGAAGLYEGLGYRLAGELPHYALKPHGGLTGTRLYWKWIGASQPPAAEPAREPRDASPVGPRLVAADLSGAVFEDVERHAASYRDVSLRAATFVGVDLRDAVLRDCDVDGMTIDGIPVAALLRLHRADSGP